MKDSKKLYERFQQKQSMEKEQRCRKKVAILLLTSLLFSVSNPVMAAGETVVQETQQTESALQKENTYTLAQIIQQIQQHNRVSQQYQLNLSLLDETRTKAKNSRKDVESTLNSVYDKESDAYDSLGTVGKNQASVQQAMQLVQQLIMAENPNATSAQIEQILKSDSRYLSLQAQMTALTGMESQLNSGITTAEDAIEQLWDGLDEVDTTLRTIENKQDDVTKSQTDWNEEVKLITNLLVCKTVTMEHTQDLLEQKAALLQKQYDVSVKQEKVGLSVPVKTKEIQLSIQENATQLEQVKDGVQLLKRQLNDMMGRSLDAVLDIEPVAEQGYVSIAPVYSADLLKQVRENDYTLKTLQRDIDNYKEDAQDLKDKGTYESDTLKIYDLNIELSKVSIQNEEIALDNDLKKQIDAVKVAGQTYQEKLDAYQNAKVKYQQNQTYAEVGLISPLVLQAAGLEYEQAGLARQQAAYDYMLAKLEYEAFLKGTDLSIYEQYKGL